MRISYQSVILDIQILHYAQDARHYDSRFLFRYIIFVIIMKLINDIQQPFPISKV